MKENEVPKNMYIPEKIYLPYKNGKVIGLVKETGVPYKSGVDGNIEYIRTDTLEVKEMDLEEEIKLNYNPADGLEFEEYKRIAKYYFELGIKAQKGE